MLKIGWLFIYFYVNINFMNCKENVSQVNEDDKQINEKNLLAIAFRRQTSEIFQNCGGNKNPKMCVCELVNFIYLHTDMNDISMINRSMNICNYIIQRFIEKRSIIGFNEAIVSNLIILLTSFCKRDISIYSRINPLEKHEIIFSLLNNHLITFKSLSQNFSVRIEEVLCIEINSIYLFIIEFAKLIKETSIAQRNGGNEDRSAMKEIEKRKIELENLITRLINFKKVFFTDLQKEYSDLVNSIAPECTSFDILLLELHFIKSYKKEQKEMSEEKRLETLKNNLKLLLNKKILLLLTENNYQISRFEKIKEAYNYLIDQKIKIEVEFIKNLLNELYGHSTREMPSA